MSDVKTKSINLLFDTPPSEVESLAQKISQGRLVFTDNVEKLSDESPGYLIADKWKAGLYNGFMGVIHPQHLSHPALEYLIERTQTKQFSVDLSESYPEFDKEVFSYRFIDPFEEGEIGDAIAYKVFSAGFDPLPFRSFHTALMGYIAHHVKRKNMMLPIDVQLGLFQGCFVIQVVVSAHMFVKEHVLESFKESDVNHSYRSFLKTCYENTHILDISHVTNPEKIVFSGIWCHSQYNLPGGTFLFGSIDQLKELVGHQSSRLDLISEKNKAHFHDLHLSGTTASVFQKAESNVFDHPYIANLVIEHCQGKLDQGGESNNVKELVVDFEDPQLLDKLSENDWEQIQTALGDVATRELLQANVESLTSVVDDDVFEKVSKIFSRMSFDEARNLVKGKIDEDQFRQIVKGGVGLADEEDVYVVTGQTVDPLADKGGFNTNSQWEKKKKEALESVREKWIVKGDKKYDQVALENEICAVIKDEIGIDADTAIQLVKGSVSSAIDEVAAERMRSARDNSKLYNQEQHYKQEIAKRDKQIRRMKAILDSIKSAQQKDRPENTSEFSSLLEVDPNSTTSAALNPDFEIARLNDEIEVLRKQIREKEIFIERENDSYTQTLEELEKKVNFYRERSGDNKEVVSELNQLKRENEKLKNQQRIEDRRIEQMSDKMDKERQNNENKENRKHQELERKLTLVEVEKSKQDERIQLLEMENEDLKKRLNLAIVPSEKTGNEKDFSKDDAKELEKLEALVREYKDKDRSNEKQLKEQHIKVRQLEQKLKFATAQLNKGKARFVNSSAQAGNSANEQRLEKLNDKLKDAMNVQTNDLNERKKEIVKLKAENNQLQHQLSELERQLAKAQKAS